MEKNAYLVDMKKMVRVFCLNDLFRNFQESTASIDKFLPPKTISIGITDSSDVEKSTCQLCKKNFKTESYLKQHLLTHTGNFWIRHQQLNALKPFDQFRIFEILSYTFRSSCLSCAFLWLSILYLL